MKWRECRNQTDREQVLRLTREPMGGKVKLIWGLETLCCPPECEHLRVYAVKTESGISGCAMAWDWPGGHHYLNGLRLSHDMASRPRPEFWKAAFESLLTDATHSWTSIGRENVRARRILESDVSWLPRYTARQSITTWFVPLPRSQTHHKNSVEHDRQLGITPLDGRHVAVASGSGFAYWLGRSLHRMGFRGITGPGQQIRIGDFRPPPNASTGVIRKHLAAASGYDGLVIVLPEDSEAAAAWRAAAPRLVWQWQSTLYSVSWHRESLLPPIPEWKGYWL